MEDLYGVLGVARSAAHEEIKRASRDLARRYHPDASGDAAAGRRFEEVHDAYAVLSDAAARAAYDETLPSVSLAPLPGSTLAAVPAPEPRYERPRTEPSAQRWRLARALEAYRFEPRLASPALDVIAW